jgi:hypothetical protein
MNINNKRGEAITLTIVTFAVLAGIVGMWFGQSKYAKVVGLDSNNQKTRQVTTTKYESKPIIVKDADGKPYILQATKSETSTLDTNEEMPMSIWQKLWMLPKIWLGLMILGIFLPPVSAVMGMINHGLKKAAEQMVAGVEKGLSAVKPEDKEKVLNELSKTYDKKTKLYVSKLKQK